MQKNGKNNIYLKYAKNCNQKIIIENISINLKKGKRAMPTAIPSA
jgi:hypothetical protein